ncbi:ATP-binding cassette domain-containing protein [Pyrofollis japonicus]|uniref:ABC transporter ATP-binding protein n=1 Tax=Pyrofollis japonicus TaxID=3060460 RepID=UPI00295BA45E|nr:ABC transporter ATP-binding protein [Pyrofollis japonicus]BEP16733.1 ATP-binding cassette domain-containing protein [Pyrofollis japonicus]
MIPILRVDSVTKYLGNQLVLDNLSMVIERPMIYGLLGPNGAGKSTLLSIIVGVLEPDSGTVLVKGAEPLSPETRKSIGYCPQENGLIEHLSGYDNALFYGRLYGLESGAIIEEATRLGERLGLSKAVLRRKVSTYSGGMKRKLAIIISLLHDPELLVLDEPTTGLDPETRREVWSLLEELRREGKAVVLATHYMEEADKLSDVVGIMDRGRLLAEGPPEELKKRYGPKTVVELRLEEPPAREIVSELSSRYTRGVYAEEDKLRLHIDDPEKIVPRILEDLYSKGYHVLELRITRPTLEDVFLKLTGRRLRG